MSAQGSAGEERQHHLDAARGLLMLLGIPFHAAHPFLADRNWLITSETRWTGFTAFVEFTHSFRMQGFFLIAGYFSAMLLLKRDPKNYVSSRFMRLIPPLAAGLIILVPIMNLSVRLQTLSSSAALSQWSYNLVHITRSWTGHLWFVIVLIDYTLVLGLLTAFLPMTRKIVLEISPRQASRWIFLSCVCVVILIAFYEDIATRVIYRLPEIAKNPFSLNFALEYAPYFGVGAVLQRCPMMMRRFNRINWPIALLGLSSAVFIAMVGPIIPHWPRCFLNAFAALGMMNLLLSGAAVVFSGERRWVRELVDASFVIYLFHMPLIVISFWLINAMELHFVIKFLLLSVVSISGSYGIWRMINQSPALLFIFSGVRRKSQRTLAVADATTSRVSA